MKLYLIFQNDCMNNEKITHLSVIYKSIWYTVTSIYMSSPNTSPNRYCVRRMVQYYYLSP